MISGANLKLTADNRQFIAAMRESAGALGAFTAVGNVHLQQMYRASDFVDRQFSKGIGRLAGEFKSAGTALTTYLTAPLALLAGSAFRGYAEFDALRRGLLRFEGDLPGVNARLTELREVAKLPGLGFQEAIQGDIRLRSVGFSAEFAKKAMLEFGNVVALSGGGKTELGGILIQLTQMSSKASVLSEDLKPILTNAPEIGRILKQLFGTVDTEQISKQLKAQGKSTMEFIQMLVNELGKLDRATGGPKNALENLSDTLFIAAGEMGTVADKALDLTGFLNGLGNGLQSAVTWFAQLSPSVQKAILVTVGLAAALGPLSLAVGGLISIWPTLVAGFIGITGPIGLAAAAIGTVVSALISWNATVVETTTFQEKLASLQGAIASGIKTETTNLSALMVVARDETKSKQERLNAIKQINDISPEFLGNITLETINTQSAIAAHEKYVKVLELRTRAQIASQRLSEAQLVLQRAEEDIAKQKIGTLDMLAAAILGGGNAAITMNNVIEKQFERTFAPIKAAKEEIGFYENVLKSTTQTLNAMGVAAEKSVPKLGAAAVMGTNTKAGKVEAQGGDFKMYAKEWAESQKIIQDAIRKGVSNPIGLEQMLKDSGGKLGRLQMPEIEWNMDKALEGFDTFAGSLQKRAIDRFGMLAEVLTSVTTGAFEGLGEAIGEGIATGSFKKFTQGVINLIAQAAAQIGRSMIAMGAPLLLAGFPYSALGLRKIAAGTGLIAASGVIKSIAGFEQGGIFGGESIIRVAEYPYAKTDPELVGRMSEVGKFMTPFFQRAMQMGQKTQGKMEQGGLRPQLIFNPTITGIVSAEGLAIAVEEGQRKLGLYR